MRSLHAPCFGQLTRVTRILAGSCRCGSRAGARGSMNARICGEVRRSCTIPTGEVLLVRAAEAAASAVHEATGPGGRARQLPRPGRHRHAAWHNRWHNAPHARTAAADETRAQRCALPQGPVSAPVRCSASGLVCSVCSLVPTCAVVSGLGSGDVCFT